MKLIKESLSGIIYHFCNFENVYHILMSNKMILTSAYNTTSDLKFQRGRLFYASFTRQYSGEIGYAKHMNDMFSSQIDKKTGKPRNMDSQKLWSRITFDGDLLSQNYKGVQVNNQAHGVDIITNRQSEDRLITNKPYIDGVTRYILGVDILLPANMRKDVAAKRRKMIRTMIISSKVGSKIRVFTDEKEFNTPNSQNFIDAKTFFYDEVKKGKDTTNVLAVDDINRYNPNSVSNLSDIANAMVFVGFGENVTAQQILLRYNLVPHEYRQELENLYNQKIQLIKDKDDIDAFSRQLSNLRRNIKGESKWVYSNCMAMITSYLQEHGFKDFNELKAYKKDLLQNIQHYNTNNRKYAMGENTWKKSLSQIIKETIDNIVGDKKKIKLVIFDFDGTLVDTTAIDNYRTQAKSIKDKNERLEFYRQFFQETKPYSGIVNVLNKLNSMGILIAVVSLSPKNMVQELCSYHNLPIQMAISVPGRKAPLNVIKGNQTGYPKSTIYRILMDKLGIDKESVLAVGDESSDAREASKAGIYFLGCNWGGRNEVNDISNPMDILDYV